MEILKATDRLKRRSAPCVSLDLPNTIWPHRHPNLELPLLLSTQISKNGPGPATHSASSSSCSRPEPAAKILFYQTPARLSSPSCRFFSARLRHRFRPAFLPAKSFSRRRGNFSLYPRIDSESRWCAQFFAKTYIAPTVAASLTCVGRLRPGSRFSNIQGPSDGLASVALRFSGPPDWPPFGSQSPSRKARLSYPF